MSSRVDRYNLSPDDELSRVKKNENSYNSSDINNLSRIKTNSNISIISNAHKDIDLEKIKKYISDNEIEEDQRRTTLLEELPKEEEIVVVRKEEKEYDVNSILERAKDNRDNDYEDSRHRKIDNTQINILKSIKITEEAEKNVDEDTTGPIEELNTEEKTLVELINGIKTHKNSNKQDLFADLMGDDDDTVVAAIKDEKDSIKEDLLNMTQDLENIKDLGNSFTKELNFEKEKLKLNQEENNSDNNDENPKCDKSFYTNSITFDKSDFEGFEDIENEVKKNSVFNKIIIAIIILLLLGTLFMIINYVFDLNII